MQTRIVQVLFPLLVLFSAFLMHSCELDEEENPVPTFDRDKFIGAWNVSESCSRDFYSVEIVANPANSSQVIIKNFWLIGFQEKPPYAIVSGNIITLPKQAICDNFSNEVSGSGKLDKNQITWNYTVNDGADLWSCSSTYTRIKE